MKKTIVGFDIGNSNLKVAVEKKKQISVYTVAIPENLVVEGEIKLPRLMVDFLKEVKKGYKIKSGPCGLIVSDSQVVCRSFSMPPMTEKQLKINLPFEFNDYISDEPDRYVYDYAVQEITRDEEGKPKEMKLTGAVISKQAVEDYIEVFKNAGFQLQTLIPQEMALSNLMRKAIEAGKAEEGKEYCIINLGYEGTRVYILKGAQLQVIRTVSMGGADIDKAIATNENVDTFMAATYKTTNYNNVLEREYCRDMFTRLTLEIMKVINFYYFNNRESSLDNVFFVGGTANIEELCQNIADTTNLTRHSITELISYELGEEEAANGLLAIGTMLQ